MLFWPFHPILSSKLLCCAAPVIDSIDKILKIAGQIVHVELVTVITWLECNCIFLTTYDFLNEYGYVLEIKTECNVCT